MTYASFAPFHMDIDDGSFSVDGNVPCSNIYCKVYASNIKNLNQRKKERQTDRNSAQYEAFY